MLCRFESQFCLKKFFSKYFKEYSAQFQGVTNHETKLLPKKFNFSGGRKFCSHVTNIQEGAEKIRKKCLLPKINDYKKLPIKNTYLNANLGILYINFDEAQDLEYPIIWLRDNCQCRQCFDSVSNSRIHGSLSFTNDIIPTLVKTTEQTLSITWGDKHQSHYCKDWLCQHSFQIEHQLERIEKDYIRQISWDANSFNNILPNISFKFDDLIVDDNSLLRWLEVLASLGVTKVFNVPLKIGPLVQLSQRVSFIRKTHYGEEFYIRGESDANNVAYQKGPLPIHTDLPYYQYVPGVVLLHYITQSSTGGENILADGLNVVHQISRKTYNILATTLVDWLDIGFEKNSKFHSMHRAPVICENYIGNIERINWSQPQRNSVFNVSPEQARLWYQAYKEFYTLLSDSKNAVNIKVEEGCILAFDNRRILHGRSNFTDKRFLCGAYLDWDEIYSKIRVLRQDLNSYMKS